MKRHHRIGDPGCTHPRRIRTLLRGGSVTGWTAQFDCPDCGFANYGDAGSMFDRSMTERARMMVCRQCARPIEWRFDSSDVPFGFWYDAEMGTECCGATDNDYHSP